MNTDIGLKIKELRKEKKLTQLDFSGQINIDNSQLSKIEKGKLMPTLQQILEISSKFNTSLDWLFGISTPKNDTYISVMGHNNTGDIGNNNDITINHGYSKVENKENIQDNQEHNDKVISAMQKQIEAMEKALAYAEKNTDSLEYTISIQEKITTSQEREIHRLQEKITNKDQEIKQLQEKLTQLKKENAQLKKQTKSHIFNQPAI